MAAQLRLIRWTLPAFALIIGLLWYRRRRVERGDPGGKSNKFGSDGDARANLSESGRATAVRNRKLFSSSRDSGVHTDESLDSNNLDHSVNISSPRKAVDNTGAQVRRSPPQPIIFTKSIVERHHRSTNWEVLDDDDITKVLDRTDPVLNNKARSKDQSMAAKKREADEEQDPDEQELNMDSYVEVRRVNVFRKSAEEATDSKTPLSPLFQKKEVRVRRVEAPVDKEDEEVEVVVVEAKKAEDKPRDGDIAGKDQSEKNREQNEMRSHVEERDSANHSPVSGVLEGSVTDEVRSEGSTDSGKGGSIKGQAISSNQTFYDFYVPQNLVGRLIGRHGTTLQSIRTKSGTKINIKKQSLNGDEYSICLVEGTPEAIQMALAHIRKLFPLQRYPNFTMDQISYLKIQDDMPISPSIMQLSLIDNINNDVIVCNITRPNRLFVQLPTHPAYPSLRTLDESMTQLYESYDSPRVPLELVKGQIVAVNLFNKWLRASIEIPDSKGEATFVRLLDHGGFWHVPHAAMRKIRNDYLSLPFQAIEVFLANVKPKNVEWEDGAYNTVQQLCSVVGQAQIVGYIDNYTYVNLFFNVPKHGLISLADELILGGYADHASLEELVPEEYVPPFV